MQFDPYVQRARRATTATSILGTGAWIGLLAGVIFWCNFFWYIVAPTGIPELALTWAMAMAYAVVLPILLSTLVPSTPAGMLLQSTKWRTIGFATSIGASGFLVFHAFTVLWAWWQSRPAAMETGQDLYLAIGSCIVFILVPALSWVQAAPDRWVAEVQAAQQVTQLKAAHEANIMIAKTRYLRALSLLRRGVANLTAAESQELADIFITLQRAENEAVAGIVDSLENITGVSTGIRVIDDDLTNRAYTGLTQKLSNLIAPINDRYDDDDDDEYTAPALPVTSHQNALQRDARTTASAVAPPPPSPRPVTPHQSPLEPVTPPTTAHTTVAHGDAPRRTVAQGGLSQDDLAAFYHTARAAFPSTFTVKQLYPRLEVGESTAREILAGWRGLGWVDTTNLKGHYCWKGDA
jgi:hypothetical protein